MKQISKDNNVLLLSYNLNQNFNMQISYRHIVIDFVNNFFSQFREPRFQFPIFSFLDFSSEMQFMYCGVFSLFMFCGDYFTYSSRELCLFWLS